MASVTVDEARRIVLARTGALPAEDVDLEDASGRVLAEGVDADLDVPPFDRAMMDGYAVRARDVSRPVVLRVVGQVRAGSWRELPVGEGEAVQIMTGAPVPPGADAVQQVEKTREQGADRVELLEPVQPGQNVAPRGSEVTQGSRVLEAGRRIDAASLAVLATAGRARVRVGRRPRVAVLVTGDELVPVAQTPARGQIRNSNGPTTAAQARACGAEVTVLGVVPDDASRIAEAARRGLDFDVLILSGGVSAGAFDLVEPVLEGLGVEKLFDRVAVKPGAPLVFGHRGGHLVFGLPGNPVSAQVTFELFVRPVLLRLQGARDVERPILEAELTADVTNRSGRCAYLPAWLRSQSGRLLAEPLRSMGSADVVAHAGANALIVLEPERRRAAAGERVPALVLARFLEAPDA